MMFQFIDLLLEVWCSDFKTIYQMWWNKCWLKKRNSYFHTSPCTWVFTAFIHNCQHRQANKIPFSCWGSVPKSCMTATPWTMACQAPLSFTISQSLFKFTSIKSVMLSNHLIFYQPLLPLPSIFPSIRVFSNELAPCIRWSKYWSFGNSPSNEY